MGSIETRARHAGSLRQTRRAVLLPRALSSRPWAARLIATLRIVLMTVGLSVPFAGRDLLVQGDSVSRSSETWTVGNAVGASLAFLRLWDMSLPLPLGFGAVSVYSLLTLGGLALIPLLWRLLSAEGAVRVRWTYAAWLSLLTILAVVGLPAWGQFMSQPPPAPWPETITLGTSYLLPGAMVFPLGVLVNGVALALILREPLPLLLSPPAPAPRSGWQLSATLVLTAGALVWVVGFYLMPETTTAACPLVIFSASQFAHGTCAGLDSDQVQAAASYAGLDPIGRFFFAVGTNFVLLVAVGGITALGGWTRQLAVGTLAWLAAWPALALGVALVALQGVGVIAQHGFKLTATSSNWHMGPGMVVTFIGIGLVALGQLGL
jgi:hypothetical protein